MWGSFILGSIFRKVKLESSEGVLLFFFIGGLISGGIGAIIGSSLRRVKLVSS